MFSTPSKARGCEVVGQNRQYAGRGCLTHLANKRLLIGWSQLLHKSVPWSKQFETFKLPIADEVADAVGEQQQKERLRGAVRAITKSGRSLYTLAVLSGKVSAVKMVHEFVRRHVDGGLFESGEVRVITCCIHPGGVVAMDP